MRGKWIILFLLLLPFSLPGSSAPPYEAPQVDVVTEIQVIYEEAGEKRGRSFTQQEALETILTYLRQQHPLGHPELDPERIIGPRYTIDVTLSDGQHHIYHQCADQYVSRDYHPWQKIDQAAAAQFYALFLTTPGFDVL